MHRGYHPKIAGAGDAAQVEATTGRIGVGIQAGYFRDRTGRTPTAQEVQLFHSSLPWHDFYPGDTGIDSCDRLLYFYAASLDAYPPGPPYYIREQAQENLARCPGRLVAFYSEPNNTQFTQQHADPQTVAARLIPYVDFVTTYCPTCQLFGPIYTQPDVAGLDNPFDHYTATLREIIKLGRQDVVKALSPGMNFYAQGKTADAWVRQIQTALRRMRAINVQYGGRDAAIVPEFGAPRGDASQQAATALLIAGVLPTLRAESVASFYFASPWVWEPSRGFNGRGDTFTANYTPTYIGVTLGLTACPSLKDLASKWPVTTVRDIMAGVKCGG